MANCHECSKAVAKQAANTKIVCYECKNWFHTKCVQLKEEDVDRISSQKQRWKCARCGTSEVRKDVVPSASDIYELLQCVRREIVDLRQSVTEIERELGKSINACHEKSDENRSIIDRQQQIIDRQQNIIESLVGENKRLNNVIEEMNIKVDDQEQYSRANTLEIYGVPESPNENVVQTVLDIGKALHLDLKEEMIDACHRLRKLNNRPTPGIIVKFVRRYDKERILQKRRVVRNLSTRHLGMTSDTPIYINQSLTATRRILFAKAKQLQREKEYKYLWVDKAGRIKIRKNDTSAIITLKSTDDINKL